MDPQARHPGLSSAPLCRQCWTQTEQDYVQGTTKGNQRRPYYYCASPRCGRKFSCFRDMRGIHLENPACDCPEIILSRQPVAGAEERLRIPRSIFFSCAVGRCDFFGYLINKEKEVIIFREPIWCGEEMARIGC